MSTINVDNYGDGTDSVPASAVLEGTAKAWTNFDGTAGTISQRQGYNVSSLTDVATGNYDVNFTNNFANTDYSPNVLSSRNNSWVRGGINLYSDNTTSKTEIDIGDDNGSAADRDLVCAQIWGDLA